MKDRIADNAMKNAVTVANVIVKDVHAAPEVTVWARERSVRIANELRGQMLLDIKRRRRALKLEKFLWKLRFWWPRVIISFFRFGILLFFLDIIHRILSKKGDDALVVNSHLPVTPNVLVNGGPRSL